LAGRIVADTEMLVTRGDGTQAIVLASATPLRTDEGEIWGAVTVYQDITKRKQAEEQVRQLQKEESLGRMAGAIAHHYNNLLAAVMWNLELAMMELPARADDAQNLSHAMSAARRAAELSGRMLAYLGQTPVRRELSDLAETCRRYLPNLRSDLPDNLTLDADLPSPGPAIKANVAQIQQILENLISNAREAMGERRGVISLSVKTVTPADIPTSRRFPIDWQPREDGYVCLEVTDRGSGIKEADIEKIFDPFFSTKFTGRGLGLPVTLGAIKNHRGCIAVDCKADRGCVFRVYLPLMVEPLPVPKDKVPETSVMLEGGRVLLVEDQEMVRNTAKAMLEQIGFDVVIAKDGIEAVEIFRDNPQNIALVLSDLTMPRMNGWETMRAVRAIRPDVPVILSSGYDESQAMAGHHDEKQPQGFLHKPYPMKVLKETLERIPLRANRTQGSQTIRKELDEPKGNTRD
jgi:two-component system cell cycle sensor histidine kinase/response regulator CckA